MDGDFPCREVYRTARRSSLTADPLFAPATRPDHLPGGNGFVRLSKVGGRRQEHGPFLGTCPGMVDENRAPASPERSEACLGWVSTRVSMTPGLDRRPRKPRRRKRGTNQQLVDPPFLRSSHDIRELKSRVESSAAPDDACYSAREAVGSARLQHSMSHCLPGCTERHSEGGRASSRVAQGGRGV